jgi:hypothetical protein
VQTPAPHHVPLSNVMRPWGPGAGFYLLRNCCGMAGIRWLSPPLQRVLAPILPPGPLEVASDMSACIATCVFSLPLNACWSYIVTTPSTWALGANKRTAAMLPFLRQQYLSPPSSNSIFSALALRDLKVRSVYIACVFSMFAAIERAAVTMWPQS